MLGKPSHMISICCLRCQIAKRDDKLPCILDSELTAGGWVIHVSAGRAAIERK